MLGAVGKTLLGMPTSQITCLGFSSGSTSCCSFLLMCTWEAVLLQVVGPCHHRGDQTEFCTPGFGLAQSCLLWALGSEPVGGRSYRSVSLPSK